MQKRNGVWVFTRKDTYDLDSVLSPVIAAGLKKYREVVSDPNCVSGIPNKFITDHNLNTETDADYKKALELWYQALDDMIYAFDTEEPEFQGEFVDGPDHMKATELGHIWDRKPEDSEAWDVYVRNLELHNERVSKGCETFGKYYKGLWW